MIIEAYDHSVGARLATLREALWARAQNARGDTSAAAAEACPSIRAWHQGHSCLSFVPGTNCWAIRAWHQLLGHLCLAPIAGPFVPGTNWCHQLVSACHQLLSPIAEGTARGNAELAQLARFAQNRVEEKAKDACRFWNNHCETSGSAQIGQNDDGP